MIDHPDKFSKKFIANLFNQSESKLSDFFYKPVGSGQVGDCYRVTLDWKENHKLPSSFIAKCPACLLYTSPSPRDLLGSRMPSSA